VVTGQLSLEPDRDDDDDAPYEVDSLPDPLDPLIPEELLNPLGAERMP